MGTERSVVKFDAHSSIDMLLCCSSFSAWSCTHCRTICRFAVTSCSSSPRNEEEEKQEEEEEEDGAAHFAPPPRRPPLGRGKGDNEEDADDAAAAAVAAAAALAIARAAGAGRCGYSPPHDSMRITPILLSSAGSAMRERTVARRPINSKHSLLSDPSPPMTRRESTGCTAS